MNRVVTKSAIDDVANSAMKCAVKKMTKKVTKKVTKQFNLSINCLIDRRGVHWSACLITIVTTSLLLFAVSVQSFAQTTDSTTSQTPSSQTGATQGEATQAEATRAQTAQSPQTNTSLERLNALIRLIDANKNARVELRQSIAAADPIELVEMQQALDELNADFRKLQTSFEQTAIGVVDVDVLGEIDTSFDWQVEVSELLRPIVENMKGLTDRPRKIGKLVDFIDQKEAQGESIDTALESIEQKIEAAKNQSTNMSLADLKTTWERYQADNIQEIEVAKLQLAGLRSSDESWWDLIKTSFHGFVFGRGLTLVIAIIASLAVWFVMRLILRLFQMKTSIENKQSFQTRKRLAQYSYRLLTALLIVVAVITVFYVRGDMLLMGLSILGIAGIAVGLRHAIPRFIDEAKILLNLGNIREQERVIYNGLPWQVTTLNMQSTLTNPGVSGVVRLPLETMREMISRPAAQEAWFPASIGDYVLLDDGRLVKVNRLTPETVELQERGGAQINVPASQFYEWTFTNLSRGDSYGISSEFGIDYRHQSISLVEVPNRFKAALQDAFSKGDFSDVITSVEVELKSAGASSLDYWVHITVDSSAAKSYKKLSRLVQQTCVAVCSEEQWGIPFPQMTLNKP